MCVCVCVVNVCVCISGLTFSKLQKYDIGIIWALVVVFCYWTIERVSLGAATVSVQRPVLLQNSVDVKSMY